MEIGVTVGDSIDRVEASADEFAFVELGVGAGSLRPGDVDPDRLAQALGGRELLVHLPFDQVLVNHAPELNEAIVAYQRRLLREVAEFGAEKAVLHGTTTDRDDLELREAFTAQLEAVVDAGDDAGVEVVVENVGHQHHGVQLSVLADAAADAGAAVCFDVGHAYMEAGNDGVKRFLRSAHDRITHLHVHDVRRRGDTHIPIGAGEIDYGILAEEFGHFEGTAALEVFTDDQTLLADSARRVAEIFDTEW